MLYNIIRKRITRGVQSLLKDHKYISFAQFYMLSNIYEKQDIFWVTERIKNLSLLVDVHNRYVSRCDAFINPNNESVVRILSTVVTLRPISFPYFLCCILIFHMAFYQWIAFCVCQNYLKIYFQAYIDGYISGCIVFVSVSRSIRYIMLNDMRLIGFLHKSNWPQRPHQNALYYIIVVCCRRW